MAIEMATPGNGTGGCWLSAEEGSWVSCCLV